MNRMRILAFILVFAVASIPAYYLGSAFATKIAEGATVYWCGVFVKHANGTPVQNIAVSLGGFGSGPYTYPTDKNGYTGRIFSTGISNGCPGGLDGVEIAATVLYNQTNYAVYLIANQNVTLGVS